MDESISNQELRRRLMVFKTTVPPVTASTRKLLLEKLAKLENGEADKSSTSKIMPPPKSKAQKNTTNDSIMISSSLDSEKQSQHIKSNSTNSPRKSVRRRLRNLDTYDTSDSEVDAGSIGRSILIANPHIASSTISSETSFMNVSNRTSIADTNDDQNSYSSSPDTKDKSISNQELRRRLQAFNLPTPLITSSTKNMYMAKLAKLENGEADKSSTSKIMPPPNPIAQNNKTNDSIMISSSLNSEKQSQHLRFNTTNSPKKSIRRRRNLDNYDTSDSEVDAGSPGRSLLPANPYIASSSPKSNETSLMNVSKQTSYSIVDANADQNSYSSSPEIKKATNRPSEKITTRLFETKISKTPTEPSSSKLRSSPPSKISSNADLVIQRWREKNKLNLHQTEEKKVLNTPIFNSPSPIPKVSAQNSRKNIQSAQQKYQGKNFTKNTINILLLFIGFFVLIFGLYFISIQSSTPTLPPGVLNSLCAKKNLTDSKCIVEQEKVQRLYNSLVSHVQDKYIKNQCDKSDINPSVNAQTVFEYFSTHENMPSREIEDLIELFKSIAKTYSDSPIGFDTSFNINAAPNLPIICAAKKIFANMFYLITWIGIVVLSVVGLYFVACYITTKSENHKQEVNTLVENTIKLLKEQALNRPNENYLPIIHIRDYLIPFDERQAKSKVWAEVVQYFTESESSVRSEVQEIDGEDFQVWRWVHPMSSSM